MSQRQLDKAKVAEKEAALSANRWGSLASGNSREGRSERGAATRKCTRKAKKGLSKARRRVDKATITVETEAGE